MERYQPHTSSPSASGNTIPLAPYGHTSSFHIDDPLPRSFEDLLASKSSRLELELGSDLRPARLEPSAEGQHPVSHSVEANLAAIAAKESTERERERIYTPWQPRWADGEGCSALGLSYL